MEILMNIGLLIVGFIMLIKGADWFVEGASSIADRFGIPQLVIGLTIVAMGTSAPEAAVSISAALKGSAEITIGNVVGSNILNILLILGVTAVIRAIKVEDTTIKYEIPAMILMMGLLAFLGLRDNVVSRMEGGILLVCMVLYLVYLLWMARNGVVVAEDIEEEQKPIFKLLIYVVIGIVAIVWGSNIAVDAATEIARIFHLSERLIGLTIVALGTSLPELVTSVTAAMKGKSEIAVGNIVGSTLFNIMFVVGIAAAITPVVYSASFWIDSIVATASAVALLLFVAPKERLGRTGGVLLLIGYAAYFVYLVTM